MADNQSKQGAFAIPKFSDFKLFDSKGPDVAVNRTPSAVTDRDPHDTTESPLLQHKEPPFKFITTWRFWAILILGQILSWCIVSTNTFTQYLALEGANIPAFQTLFNYVLLNIVYTSWTWYKYGFKKWFVVLWKDGWKYFILAFVDVQGVI
jgi:hypothetical protein